MEEITEKIARLKKERNAIILAHNYQREEVQLIADVLGDSLDLSRQAASAQAEVVIFCGVHFMAESAAMLAPEKKVILPDENAGCPLADMVTPQALRERKKEFPQAAVVCYINSSAAVKAESDICCTSANAVKVVNYVKEKKILFIPDKNLAHFVSRFTDKEIIPWEGYCITHHRVSAEEILEARKMHPEAVVIVHPECKPEVVDLADEVFSTSGMVKFARESAYKEIIVGTEMGLVQRLRRENPDKQIYLASPKFICPNMKLTTLEKVLRALETLKPEIRVEEPIRSRAKATLDKMLAIPRDR
jgi:quinolinate synthase